MEIRHLMTKPVHSLPASATILDAARLMAEHEIGAVPVLDGPELLGVVTDRDITVRGIARGLKPDDRVVRAMTFDVVTCRESAIIDDVLETMVTHGVRRVPICSVEGGLTGIVTLSDLARIDWDKERVARTLADTCASRRLKDHAKACA